MVKVSVVIPVYNVEEFLGECLDSITNQTLEDIEIICVNDGSKDKSLEILNEYASRDERITVIDQENGGHAVATNNGMKLAKGKYLFLMDSDDILDLNALEESYNVAEEKNVDFVIFQAINYYMDTGKLIEAENYSMNEIAAHVGDSVFDYRDVKDYVFDITVTPWSKLYNREFIEKNSITFPEGLVFDDNVFFYDVLFAADRITFLKKHLFKRRWYSASSTRSGARHFKDYIQICDLIWQVFIKYGVFWDFERELYHKKVSTVYYWYKNINDEFKDIFFDEMKQDYLKIVEDEEFYKNFMKKLTRENRTIFTNAIEADNHRQFSLLMENYELKKEIKNLKKKIEEFESSRSWKITRPLRSIKK
ncbi:MAG: glycosyltransferase [Methanobrevibacter sp.]|uniref:glycosyltransferase family 2 protein n=1 Tax=Methanobrevibacter sp. TaxID=66852 RepID=UPI0025DF2956|nr:glycosyltransferase [Methanobrevibacter sp.]MBQ6100231.1 glycosyltransferase [Methanobrevibacter sp.]